MDFQHIWSQIQAQIQTQLQAGLNKLPKVPASDAASMDFSQMLKAASPEQLKQMADIQAQYLKDAQSLWAQGLGRAPVAAATDKRFASPAWTGNPFFAQVAGLYQLNARTLHALADCVPGDAKTKARVKFAVGQAVDASSPANLFALNPEAQALALQSKGESIAKGISNFLADAKQGHMSLTDETQFEVGRNVGTSVGAVVFENPFFQLIEYRPTTSQVYERPFLIIPPCINKFYILDLQPANSFVAHAVSKGHRTFVLSWRNADASLDQATWDDYIEQAAITAIEAVRRLCNTPQINALGFCVGGTILGTALAVLAARRKAKPGKKATPPEVASATFLTTLLDFSDTGVLDLFIDEQFVKFREAQFAQGGLLKGQELASTFSFLRPNDLVWNYLQGNYLKGQTPPPFDLLYWNSDSTNLPGLMYRWYLRNTYLENRLCQPHALTVCGQSVDLGAITQPAYVYGSREDHIVPIEGAYASLRHLGGPTRFVMGASGHIAGVINPPAANKRSHWIAQPTAKKRAKAAQAEHPPTHAQWLQTAQERPGSWWGDWAQWLAGHAGASKPVHTGYCAKPIEDAPGRYVKAKS